MLITVWSQNGGHLDTLSIKSFRAVGEITFSMRSGANSTSWALVKTCSIPTRLIVNWLSDKNPGLQIKRDGIPLV